MILWIITSIRLGPGKSLPASTLQNIQTALALCERGHEVILFVRGLDAGWRDAFAAQFGREVPQALHLLPCRTSGPAWEKKTPFDTFGLRLLNIGRAIRIARPPDAILSRSPRAIEQLRQTVLLAPRHKIILEYQYPEWTQMWRSWKSHHPAASLAQSKAVLREMKQAEARRLRSCSGVLYAARAHKTLLARAGYVGFCDLLPSGCAAPEENPPVVEKTHDLGYVGKLSPENGVAVLLRAAARIPDATLLVVGDGPREHVEELKGLAWELGVGERVQFAGSIEAKDVRSFMHRCRIGVVPISARRGPEKRQYASPLKLVEWAAAGVPIVASGVPSILQSIQPGENAIAVRPDSPDDLARATRELLEKPMELERLRRNVVALGQFNAFANRAARIEAFIRRLG